MIKNNILYRMRDLSGDLLYVGITWWAEIVAIELEHFPSRDDLELAEVAAIRAEAPRYNLRRYDEERPLISSASMKEADRVRGHNVRIEDGLWRRFGAACKASGQSRTSVIVAFLMWFCRVPGAKLPKRPEPGFELSESD